MTLAIALIRECWNRRVSPLHLVSRDPLTGLFNRLAWEIWGRRIRNVDYMMLDLDGMKRVNDTRGHEAGDKVLGAVGEIILTKKSLKAFRIGGDEFLLLTPRTINGTIHPVELAREISNANLGVTASIGCGPDFATADSAMYVEKRRKPRICVPS